jgi:transposase
MLTPLRYLAVDVAKDTLEVVIERQRWQMPNVPAGHRKLIAQIQKLAGPIQVVCEATGPYHLAMCLALQEAGLAVTIANPAQIRYFGRSEGALAKTDPIDARLIERFAQAKRPPADPPLCRQQVALGQMVVFRLQLVDTIKRYRTHRQQVHDQALRAAIDHTIATTAQRLAELEQQIRAAIEAHALWPKKFAWLTSVKGVGFVTAIMLLAKMPELGQLNRGQCAALAGVAPYDDDSGTHHGKRFIKGGRAEVRSALYMAAVIAARFNPVLKVFYTRLRQANKPFNVAITAVMRKLLIYLNGLLKTPTPYPAPLLG